MKSVYKSTYLIAALLSLGLLSQAHGQQQLAPFPGSPIALEAESVLRTDVYNVLNALRGNPPLKEADSAFRYANFAFGYIPNEIPSALSSLNRALDALDKAVKASPQAVTLPIYHDVQTVEGGMINVEEAKKVAAEMKKSAQQGRTQAVRAAMQRLSSEIRIVTLSIDVDQFRGELKKAAYILKDKEQSPGAARLILLRSFDKVIREERTIPLPVVRAESLLDLYATKRTRGGMMPGEGEYLLKEIRQQMAMAEALGYVTPGPSFNAVQAQIQKAGKADIMETQGTILSELQNSMSKVKSETTKTASSLSGSTGTAQ